MQNYTHLNLTMKQSTTERGGGESDDELIRRLVSGTDEATTTIEDINSDLVYGLWLLLCNSVIKVCLPYLDFADRTVATLSGITGRWPVLAVYWGWRARPSLYGRSLVYRMRTECQTDAL